VRDGTGWWNSSYVERHLDLASYSPAKGQSGSAIRGRCPGGGLRGAEVGRMRECSIWTQE